MSVFKHQITASMAKDIAFKLGAELNSEEAEIFADGYNAAMLKTEPATAPVMPAELHPDTQNLVVNFCTALAEKLYKTQLKYGYDADWKQDGWSTQCQAHFHQHIAKGDPRDVAAYCAFMWYHGWKTESVSVPVVPEECPADISVLMASHSDSLFNDDDAQEIWNACRAAMLQSKYRDLSQPVDPQISEYEKIMLQAGNSPTVKLDSRYITTRLEVFEDTYEIAVWLERMADGCCDPDDKYGLKEAVTHLCGMYADLKEFGGALMQMQGKSGPEAGND